MSCVYNEDVESVNTGVVNTQQFVNDFCIVSATERSAESHC